MPLTVHHLAISGAALSVAATLWKYFNTKKPPYPLPPGPKGFPIIGNLLDLPNKREAQEYARWAEVYGMSNNVSST